MKQAALAGVMVLLAASAGAQTSGPLLLILNKADATLSIVDPASGKTAGTVRTGNNPHEVAATADGRVAIVTNYGGDSLSVIDLAARTEQRIGLGELRQPHGIEMAAGVAVFTAEANRAIAAYDPATNRVAWRFPTGQDGTHMVTASRDGRTLFTSNMASNSITILERAGEDWRPTHVTVGAGPEGLDLSPDGRELWTAHSRDGGISIVDVASKKVVQRVDAGTGRSNRLKFTRDGRYALVSDLDGGELVVIDAKTRAVTRRLRLGRMLEGILVPPDGNRVYVAVTGENKVVAIDLQNFEVVQTIATGNGPDGMAWVSAAPKR